jgi:segregation and condensation protein B
MKTLQEREWVRIVGHRDMPGRPAMYGTTRQFLDYFNLKGLDDLPTLMELRDIDSINAELELRLPGEQMPGDPSDGDEASEPDGSDSARVVQVAVDNPDADANGTLH